MTLALLEKNAANGCLICSQLLNQFGSEHRDYLRGVALTCTKEQEKRSSVRFAFDFWAPPRVDVKAKFSFPNTKPVDRLWYDLYLAPVNRRCILAFSHPVVSDIRCRG